jgi:ankyrin repeat protein
MNEKYCELIKNEFLSRQNQKATFCGLLRFIPIEKLKKSPEFSHIKQAALKIITPQDIFTNTALWLTRQNMIATLKYIIDDCRFDILDLKTENGMTLLHEACAHGHREIITYLLKKGSNPNEKDDQGFTPAHILTYDKKQATLISLLKKYGANLDLRSSQGFTPLHIAAINKNGDAIKALKENNANLKIKYEGSTYLQLLAGIRSGKVTVADSQLITDNYNYSVEEMECKVIFEFLSPKRNQNQFHNCIKTLLTSERKLSHREAIFLIDVFIASKSCHPKTIINFLKQNSDRLSRSSIVFMSVRASYFLIRENLPQAAEELMSFCIVNLLDAKTKLSNKRSNKLAKLYNEIAAILNSIRSLQKSEDTIRKGLAVLDETPVPTTVASLYYNLGMCKKAQFEQSSHYFKLAFSYLKNDEDIFKEYVQALIAKNRYDEALEICDISECTPLNDIICFQIKYLQGQLSSRDLIGLLPEIGNSESCNFYISDLKSQCYNDLRDYQRAIECSELSFQLAELRYEQNREYGINHAIAKLLLAYINNNNPLAANQALEANFQKYPSVFSNEPFLLSLSAITYYLNGNTIKADQTLEAIDKIDFCKSSLAQLFAILFLNTTLLGEDSYSRAKEFLLMALTYDPENSLYKFYLLLISVLKGTVTTTKIKETLNADLFKDSLSLYRNYKRIQLEKEREKEPEKEIAVEDKSIEEVYDPIKIHAFFQQQKKLALTNLFNVSREAPPQSEWSISGKVICDTDDNVYNLNSKFYPNYYATIDENLKLDLGTLNRSHQALKNGVCHRKKGQNGIKFINKSIVELKFDADIRLYTTCIYENTEGKKLIFFNHIGNHAEIERIARTNKPLETLSLAQKNETPSTYSKTFFPRNATNDCRVGEQEQQDKMAEFSYES